MARQGLRCLLAVKSADTGDLRGQRPSEWSGGYSFGMIPIDFAQQREWRCLQVTIFIFFHYHTRTGV